MYNTDRLHWSILNYDCFLINCFKFFKSQCFERAKDLVQAVSRAKLHSEGDAAHMVNVIHSKNPFAIVTDLHIDFEILLYACRGAPESVKSLETGLEAQLS